jgi:hypothetical protein
MTTERENRIQKAEKEKQPCQHIGKEIKQQLKRNTGYMYRKFNRGTEAHDREICPHCGATCSLKFVPNFSEQEKI